MVGIVIVSHSARLAEAAAELARDAAPADLRLALAGGIDDPDHPLGTDALRVAAAIEEVYDEDGVLVLMDLGSAILSAELALELLPPARRTRICLSDAPLVEGLIAAAVQAAAGGDLDRVAREARAALTAKMSRGKAAVGVVNAEAGTACQSPSCATSKTCHLEDPGDDDMPAPTVAAPVTATVSVANALGLHARPAARIVQAVSGLTAEVTLQNATTGAGPVPADSLTAVLTLGARHGHELIVRAAGPDAEQAAAALRALAAGGFGDPPAAAAPSPDPGARTPQLSQTRAEPGILIGLPAAPGIAVGSVRRIDEPSAVASAPRASEDPATERRRLEQTLAAAATTLDGVRTALAERAGAGAAELLAAHLLVLRDPALVEAAMTAVARDGRSAEDAWSAAVQDAAARCRALDDPFLAARAADVEAVGAEVAAHLRQAGGGVPGWSGIVVAADLFPADAARMDPDRVAGILTAAGGPASHTALVARALGIPAVVAAGAEVLEFRPGALVIVDGDTGRVQIDPGAEAVAAAEEAILARAVARQQARARAFAPSATRDGQGIAVLANVGLAGDAARAAAEGADGVGLLRTEFLFLNRRTAPDEDEQTCAYTGVCEALGGRRVVLRTLDAGGDKPLPYLDLPVEANPFLGVRAIRMGLSRPGMLTTQLRAALRTAAAWPVRVLLPMVSTVGEVHRARALLAAARAALAAEGVPVPDRIDVGAMVEVPALALNARHVVAAVDFISIGTNDLTQYATAAERGNPAVAHLADPLDPGVLRLIAMVCDAARPVAVPVAVCGDLAADAAAVPLLLGLGVRELSVPPPAVAEIKQRVRATDLRDAGRLAHAALDAPSAAAVRRLLHAADHDRYPTAPC